MPYGRRYARRTKRGRANRYAKKKRWSKRKAFGKIRQPGVQRGLTSIVFPQQMYKTLTYATGPIPLVQTSTNTPINYTIRGNSPYDPDYAVGGNQPRWYDTFLGAQNTDAPYGKYICYGSKIIMTVYQDPTLGGSTGSVMGLVSIIPSQDASGYPSSQREMTERSFSRFKPIGNANASRPILIKHFAKTKNMYMGSDVDSLQFAGAYNGNPTWEWFWLISACNIIPYINAGANGLFSCYVDIKVKYYCKFFDLNDVKSS